LTPKISFVLINNYKLKEKKERERAFG